VETDTTVDVPYLGNVLVSETYRRQGIGSNLIKIGLKVAEKWKYDKLYLAVDIDNTIAFDLYKKIGFQVILDERDLINRNLKKKCRIFMAKDVAV
jgi:ribosomal protein S18 acetylase RimI-like enzyme